MAANRPFIALLISGALSVPLFAQEPQPPEAQRPAPPKEDPHPNFPRHPFFGHDREGKGGPGNSGGPQLAPEASAMRERVMREMQKLTPEQRGELWRCVWAVLNLPPEKRQMLLGQEDDRRNKIHEEIERALKDNGVEIKDENKRRFFHRYFEERRAIEEKLRKDQTEQRRTLMREMAEKLKKEFANTPAPAASTDSK